MEFFKTYIKERLLTSPQGDVSDFIYAPRLSVERFRKEINGMGAASFSIDVPDYNSIAPDPINYNDLQGKWIFIRNASEDEFVPTSINQNNFDWWGYIDRVQFEYDKNLDQYRGVLTAVEFGHYLNEYPIMHGSTSYLSNNPIASRGFNPSVDGYNLANMTKTEDSVTIKRKDYTYDYESTDNYWTIKDIVDFLIQQSNNTCPVNVSIDYSRVNAVLPNGNPNPKSIIYSREPRPGYDGMTLGEALDDLMEPFGWFFDLNNDTVRINMVDRSGLENVNYVSELDLSESSVAMLQVTAESRVYDRVHLLGNRILVSGSITTYVPEDDYVGAEPAFTSEDIAKYVEPFAAGTYPNTRNLKDNPESAINSISQRSTDVPSTIKEGSTWDTSKKVQAILDEIQLKRKDDFRTYQLFNFKLGGETDPSSAGDHLWTYEFPGSGQPGETLPFFPKIQFQSEPKDGKNGDIYSIPRIINEPCTPPLCEMLYERFIPYTDGNNFYGNIHDIQKFEPTILYRVLGAPIKFQSYQIDQSGVTDVKFSPAWLVGTKGALSSVQGYKLSLSWDGFRIDSAYPEVLASGNDDLFKDVIIWTTGDYVLSAANDLGLKSRGLRGEWLSGGQASARDPDELNLPGSGHWGRMIVSFSARSNQRFEVWKGLEATDNVLYVEDSSLEYWLLRKGLAVRTWSFDVQKPSIPSEYYMNAPEWLPENIVARSDLNKASIKLDKLFNYHNKKKRALRIEDRIVNEEGNFQYIQFNERPLQVGDFIKKVNENGTRLLSNSSVVSIEYTVSGDSPRVIISTEYPSSPVSTRDRIRPSINALANDISKSPKSWQNKTQWQQNNK